jgi:hypothetical protein
VLPLCIVIAIVAARTAIVPFGLSQIEFVATLAIGLILACWMALQFLVCLILRRVARAGSSAKSGGFLMFIAIAGLMAAVFIAVSSIHRFGGLEWAELDEQVVASLAFAGVLLASLTLPMFGLALALAWRMLDRSETQGRALRECPPCWQGITPGNR